MDYLCKNLARVKPITDNLICNAYVAGQNFVPEHKILAKTVTYIVGTK